MFTFFSLSPYFQVFCVCMNSLSGGVAEEGVPFFFFQIKLPTYNFSSSKNPYDPFTTDYLLCIEIFCKNYALFSLFLASASLLSASYVPLSLAFFRSAVSFPTAFKSKLIWVAHKRGLSNKNVHFRSEGVPWVYECPSWIVVMKALNMSLVGARLIHLLIVTDGKIFSRFDKAPVDGHVSMKFFFLLLLLKSRNLVSCKSRLCEFYAILLYPFLFLHLFLLLSPFIQIDVVAVNSVIFFANLWGNLERCYFRKIWRCICTHIHIS